MQRFIRLDPASSTFPEGFGIDFSQITDGQILTWDDTKKIIKGGSDVTGISTLNTLTANTQTFAKGSTAQTNDWGIVSSGSTHTFHFPDASASNRGLLTTTDWSTFNGKLTSPLTTKGDILSFSTVNARLPVGTNGQVVTADSTQTLGIKWATIASISDMAYVAIIDIAGDGTPTTTVLLNTLTGTTTNDISWAKFQTGIIRGTPDAGVLPDVNKAIFLGSFFSNSAVPDTLWNQQYEVVNSPRVFSITSIKTVSGVVSVANAAAQRIYVFILRYN